MKLFFITVLLPQFECFGFCLFLFCFFKRKRTLPLLLLSRTPCTDEPAAHDTCQKLPDASHASWRYPGWFWLGLHCLAAKTASRKYTGAKGGDGSQAELKRPQVEEANVGGLQKNIWEALVERRRIQTSESWQFKTKTKQNKKIKAKHN